jgi:NADH:ubiquinone oxidoreductase subunit 6 (subunit J)
MEFKFGLLKRQSIIILIVALMAFCLFVPMSVNAKEAKLRTLTSHNFNTGTTRSRSSRSNF